MAAGYTVAIRNATLDALAPNFNSGYLRIYDGSRPANADTSITDQNLIVELRFSSTAFGSASGGSITANAITSGISTYSPSTTATWARMLKSDGSTVVGDISVSTTGSDLNLSNTLIPYNTTVNVTSLTISEP